MATSGGAAIGEGLVSIPVFNRYYYKTIIRPIQYQSGGIR